MKSTIVTVIGSTYFQPVLDLAERLLARPRRSVTAGQIGGLENGYALSIVLLMVVCLESYIGRVSYLQSQLGVEGLIKAPRVTVPDYLIKLRKSFRLQKSLTKAFVLRDVIAHGHVWELEVSDNLLRGQVLHRAKLIQGYGDYKYKVALNTKTGRSTVAGLNLVPAAVGLSEAVKVFSIVRRTLQFLVKRKLIEPNAISYHGRFRGRPFDFWKLEGVLKDAA